MRLAVYLDYVHRRQGDAVFAPRAFALFVAGLRPAVDELVLVGRVDREQGPSHYRLPPDIGFVELPWYSSAANPRELVGALWGALRSWDRALRRTDVAWVLGPHGLAIPLVLLARARGKRVVLGVRQDLPAYARMRHPGRRLVHAAADMLEATFRLLGRRLPVIAVGPALAERYAHAPDVLPIAVSLVPEREVESPPPERRWDADELLVLSVGRLEEEKNPLLLADILARLRADDPRWRLVVCGEGPLLDPLRERLAELGVAEHADLRGYVPLGEGLRDMYHSAHAFLHVSRTEGLPQVLYEAFAARLPVIATAVGSVPDAGGDAVLLVPPGDADAPVRRLAEISGDEELRERLVASGLARAREHSLEAELERTARFLGAIGDGDDRRRRRSGARGLVRSATR